MVKNRQKCVKPKTPLQIKSYTGLNYLVVSAEEEVPVGVVGVEVGVDRPAQVGLLAIPRHTGHRPRLVIQELLETYI